jgi:hypothetical protein
MVQSSNNRSPANAGDRDGSKLLQEMTIKRWAAIALVFGALGCVTTTSVSRTGTGLFAPRGDSADEDEAPRGLTLSAGSIAADGTVILDLRNYSDGPFVVSGTRDRPHLIIESQSGSTHSRHTISPWSKQTYEVPAGERLQLKANIGGLSGRVRIGVRSHDLGYIVWTDWIAR